MAYTFFPTSATEIMKTLKPTNKVQKDKVSDIVSVFSYLAKNAKVKKITDKFLVIDPQKYGNIKIPRSLKGTIDPQKIVRETKVKNIKIEYGDGSAGGRGVNNKGGSFEKQLAPAIRKLYTNSNSRVPSDYKEAYNEIYNITDLKNFKTGTLEVDGEAGASNTKRPIQYNGSDITLYTTSPDNNIGDMLTDITLKGKINNKDKEIYLSLKTTTTVTFFNAGIKEVFPTDDIKKGKIKNDNGLDLLKMLGIDPSLFCDCYNHPKGWKGFSEKKEITTTQKAKLQKFLESGIGYGYTVIHQIRPGSIKVFNVDKKYMQSAATPQSLTVFYGGKTGSGKRVDVVIETPKYTLGLNIRDTQGKDGYPTRLMCNFWYK